MKFEKIYFFIAIWLGVFVYDAYGRLPDKVGSLIAADRTAANIAKMSNPYEALMSIVDKESALYVPSPVNCVNYLYKRANIPDVMAWQPNFAMMCQSLDRGVPSGPM